MKHNLAIIVRLACIIVGATTRELDPTPYIIGGTSAERDEYPFIASLQFNGVHECSGAILSPSWIVTAGHCFPTPENVTAVVGLIVLGEAHPDVQSSPARDIILHPNFTENLYDVGLIEVQKPFVFTQAVLPISLPAPGEEFKGNVAVPGWGAIKVLSMVRSKNSLKYPKTLQHMETGIIPNNECNGRLKAIGRYPWKVGRYHVCTLADDVGSGTCHADSGSPLVNKQRVLIGIVQGGDSNCGYGIRHAPSPNVYTKVSQLVTYINKAVKNKTKKS